jgi:hypothetical protein
MKVIWYNSIIAVYCDYYNAPGECSWHYEPCGTVTAKTCKDQVIGQKFSALLEGKTYFVTIQQESENDTGILKLEKLLVSLNSVSCI